MGVFSLMKRSFQALCFLVAFLLVAINLSANRFQDSLVLVDFYSNANGQDWLIQWDLNQQMESWYGVRLNTDGRVSCIDLDGMPDCMISPSFGNGLTGNITTRIGELEFLEAFLLSNNKLTGRLPESVFDLQNIVVLDVFGNEMIGPLPASMGNSDSFETLSLGGNNFIGPLPNSVGQLQNLANLLMDNNNFSGQLPPEMGELKKLENFKINGNALVGEIPEEIGGMIAMRSLNMSDNKFIGPLPNSIGEMKEMEVLILANNQLDSEIPVEIGELKKLINLSLSNNVLEGEVPAEIGQLRQVKSIMLNNNQLQGEFPGEIGQCDKLIELRIEDNNFEGELPQEIGDLDSLRIINASYNDFIGPLPRSIQKCLRLQELRISHNEFDLNLPDGLGALLNLRVIDAEYNKFIGPLPNSLRNLDRVTELRLNNNLIDGNIPDALGEMDDLFLMHIYDNDLKGCFPEALRVKCGRNFLFSNNPKLPWKGDFSMFCSGANQENAPCDDGKDETSQDKIGADCLCVGLSCSRMELNYESYICHGETLTIGGTTYSEDAQVVEELVSESGCDSIVTNNIIALRYDISTEDSDCQDDRNGTIQLKSDWQGDFAFTIVDMADGNVIAQDKGTSTLYKSLQNIKSGQFRISILDNDKGCPFDTIININYAHQSIEPTYIEQMMCPGEELTVFNNVFNQDNPTGTEVVSSVNGCDSLVHVVLEYADTPERMDRTIALTEDQLEYTIVENDNANVTIQILESNNIDAIEVTSDNMILITLDKWHSGEATLEYEVCQTDCDMLCARSTVELVKNYDGYDEDVLTPNDDGVNDILVVKGYSEYEEIPGSTISIINRWGQVVYTTTNYKNDWSGNMNGQQGKPLPEGVYYYHLIFSSAESVMGSRSLIR